MSRGNWTKIRQSNRFYVDTYRRGVIVLIISVSLNILLGVTIYNVYFSQPENEFYATAGETAPVKLTAMDRPNDSTSALLADEQNNYDSTKAAPQ